MLIAYDPIGKGAGACEGEGVAEAAASEELERRVKEVVFAL